MKKFKELKIDLIALFSVSLITLIMSCIVMNGAQAQWEDFQSILLVTTAITGVAILFV